MVYLIFDKSANPTPTLARLDIYLSKLKRRIFSKVFTSFSNLLEERGISDCFLHWTCPQKEGVGVGAEN